jgi:hypothetical protein
MNMIYIMDKIIVLIILLILIYTFSYQYSENFVQHEFCSDYKKRKNYGNNGCNFVENELWKKSGGKCPIGFDYDIDCPSGCRYWVSSVCPKI